jgi:tetratricopeptide (TPR) repeat protein
MTTTDSADVERLITDAKLAKEQAKDLRDEGDYAGAVAVLVRIIEQMSTLAPATDGPAPSTETEQRLATQLADCLGMLGGNLRRAGELKAAQEAFERGRRYEESARLQVASSYNLVNAITLPLESSAATPAELADSLGEAIAAIERQVSGERRRDRWAWADLAQCRLLLGQLDEALRNYHQAFMLGDDETMSSIVRVLLRLRDALSEKDAQSADLLDTVIGQLGGTEK